MYYASKYPSVHAESAWHCQKLTELELFAPIWEGVWKGNEKERTGRGKGMEWT